MEFSVSSWRAVISGESEVVTNPRYPLQGERCVTVRLSTGGREPALRADVGKLSLLEEKRTEFT